MSITEREHVLAVKRGEVPRADVVRAIELLEAEVRRLLDTGACRLPERADLPRITSWAVAAQRAFWQW
ncbi:hypothetical protein GCM10027289_17100 [Tsukamurella serpentis]